MKKQLLLILGILFLATSCDLIRGSTLLKFREIDKKLQVSSMQKQDSSILLIRENPQPELEVIREHTENIINEISDIKSKLNEIAHRDDAENPNYADYKQQMIYMIGNDGMSNGRAYELEKKLNSYIESINALMDDFDFEKIAQKGSEIEQFKNTEEADKDFAHLNFNHTPTIAVLAILSEFELEVRKVELKALKQLIAEENNQ